MIIMSSLIGNWEKLCIPSVINCSIIAFLFFVCTMEVILLKWTTSTQFGLPSDEQFAAAVAAYDENDEYEEDIYYEELQNNYDMWARRRMRYHRRRRLQEQQMLEQLRQQQQQYGHHHLRLPSTSYVY